MIRLAWLSGFVLIASSAAVGADLRAGVAEADITPPRGFRMSGYFMERVNTGTHDPLHAKAIVFEQGDTRAAIVICDVIGIPLEVSTRARKAIAEKAGIPVENIVVTGTHTHTGPLFFGTMRQYLHDQAVSKHGRDPCETIDYSAFLAEGATKAAIEALAAVRTVTLATATAKQDPPVSFNRRYHMKDGSVCMNPAESLPRDQIVRPAGPVDPTVSLLLLHDVTDNRPLASLTVFALHLDTTGGTEYSADYPYYIEEHLRRKLGKDLLSVFGTGTCGNVNHLDVSKDRIRNAAEIGSALANTLDAAVAALRPLDGASLAVRRAIVDAPLQTYPKDRVEQAAKDVYLIGKGTLPFLKEVEAYKITDLQSRRGPTLPLEVQAFRLNKDTAIVTLPGEPFVEFGLAIKKASPFRTTFVIELANDNPAYIPTKQAFAEGSYETVNSRVQPGAGEKLAEAAVGLLNALHN